jgi:carbonic anhydrase/acetyltransferase-like protein (isoleucine patch superfamily)
MNAVILDDAKIGDECIIGALTLVKSEMIIPNRKVVVGNPAKIIKDVSEEMITWKTEGTKIYQQLPKDCQNTLKETKPLNEFSDVDDKKISNYKTWKKTNN